MMSIGDPAPHLVFLADETSAGVSAARRMHNVVMRGAKDYQRLWAEQRVQLSRGHWQREDRAGAVRSEGWWESVTVTWTPAPGTHSRVPLLSRALATALDTIAPAAAELAAAGARRLLERRPGARTALPAARRALRAAARELPGR